ncbi:MAG: CHAD domain-containing protein [Desulfuromonadaceae bacterium]|nr:CHAD domain-containing protein [Desulfuromonadaceae bacterium]
MPPKPSSYKQDTCVNAAISSRKYAENDVSLANLPCPDPATILDRSRGVFFAQWEELLRLRRTVIKTSDPDDIHDLRVASRRFRAALELFYPFVPKGPKTVLRKRIRTLTRTLGGLRNIDEAELFFRSHLQAEASTGSTLFLALSKRRTGELKRIRKALKAFDHRHLDRMVRQMVAGLNEVSISKRRNISLPAYFSDVSIRQYQPIRRLLAVSMPPEQRALRHALRIAVKKWRYFFEIVATILDRDYTQFLELLKEYQSILGRMNDITVFEALLGDLRLPSHEREHARAALLADDAHMLKEFTELVERKPLTYTF